MRLATESDNGAARLWSVYSNDLIDAACRRVRRNLTLEEWRRYFGEEPYHVTCKGAETLLDFAGSASAAGDDERVIELTSEWLRLDPKSADAYALRGYAVGERLQDYESAVADLKQVNRLMPDDSDAWGMRAWYLILLSRWDEARKIAARAQALDPDSYAWSVNLGHTYLLKGDRGEAQRWYERTLPLIPDQETLRAGPLADFDLFIERGWQTEAARDARAWFERNWTK
jgi:tetratricopeptide (TPR) repeat protein